LSILSKKLIINNDIYKDENYKYYQHLILIMPFLNNLVDQVYLINLKRRPEKLIKVLWGNDPYFPKLPLQIIEAYDGQTIHKPAYIPEHINQGAYGYILTWESIIREAIRKKQRRVLILDDDAIFAKDFDHRFQTWYQTLFVKTQTHKAKAPKIILLGASQHGFGSVQIDLALNYYHPKHTDGSFAVILDHSIFSELLSLLKTHQKVVDSQCLRELYRKYTKSCYVVYPNLVIADLTSSDIREPRSQTEMALKFRWGDLNLYHDYRLPLVSIIIPCYQAEKTIERCLESMIAQTYRPLEIIAVEDGSTDSSFDKICQIFQKWLYDPRASSAFSFQVYRHSQNKGCYPARNTGLGLAKGDLITFQDADDISLPTRIEKQVMALLKEQVEVVCCQFLRTHLKVLTWDLDQLAKDLEWSTQQHPGEYCCRPKIALATTLFRRSFLERLRTGPHQPYYLEKYKWGSDSEFMMRYFTSEEIGFPEQTVMSYLNQQDKILHRYYQVKEVLYASHEMTEQNLTSQRLKVKLVKDSKPKGLIGPY
jgi:glycosyltransferase involved in cell wall biosynthesis